MGKRIFNKKNENGAITLFVLLTCLFFVFILTGVYISNLNRLQVQEQEVTQIQENYAKDLSRVDEIYENLSRSMAVTLSQNPQNDTWTNGEVTLTGTAQIKEGNTATIVGYAFTKDTTNEASSWTSVSNKTEITETITVTENGTYYFWAKDSDGEIKQSNKVEVTNIDKTAPTAGTLIAKELDDDGNEIGDYDLSKSLWTDKSVYIEKVDGTDDNGTATLTSGKISSNKYGVYNYSSSTNININGGTVSSNEYGIYNSDGTTNISLTVIDSNTYGIYNAGGTTTINAGTEITNGTYGIYNSSGTTTIKEASTVQSNTGVYVANGRLNIGETGTMNATSPVIVGEEYGLSVASTGIAYMYDGQIKGKTGSTKGRITNTENGYLIANKVEGEYFVNYLALSGTISTVAQVNGIDFSNLQSAINSITGEEDQTIILTNGIISDSIFTISEGQNIILDMSGKTISSDLATTIQNDVNLTIIDSTSSGVGKISSTVGTAIVNSGTLTLGQDDETVSQDILTIEGTTYGIENTGTLNFYDGTINGASAVSGTITNRPDGYVIRITTVNSKERYYLST